MQRTVLDMVQGILEKLDSDPVNSITDTWEAEQVAGIIRQTYIDIVEEYNLPAKNELIALEGLGDTNKPSHLKLPDNVRQLHWFKYNKKLEVSDADAYADVQFLEPHLFVEMCNARDSTDTTNFKVVTYGANVRLTIAKLSAPRYWTSFDNEYLVCDGYDSNIDTTLQESKTQAYVSRGLTFTMDDEYIPELPDHLFGLLYRTAENEAYAISKQVVNPKLEQKERRLRIRAQRSKQRLDAEDHNYRGSKTDYGRR